MKAQLVKFVPLLRAAALGLIIVALIAALRGVQHVFGIDWNAWLCMSLIAVLAERMIEKL